MFGRLSFGNVRGIPITASGSWLLVLCVLIWFVGDHLRAISDVSQTVSVLLGAVTVLLFFGSVVAHELGHAFVARRAGLKVEGIELWMFGGFARLSGAPRTPREQLKIAAAGPLVTLVLAAALLGGVAIVDSPGLSAAWNGQPTSAAAAIVVLIGSLNAIMLVLNLLPVYPLDGGVIARAVAWKITGDPHRATRMAARGGFVVGLALISAGTFLLITRQDQADGFALGLLGWLVTLTSRGSIDVAERQQRLDQVTVGAIANPAIGEVDGHHTVLDATDSGGPPGPWVVVRQSSGAPALVSATAMEEALGKGQPALTLAELAEDVGDRTMPSDTPLREAVADPRLRDGSPLLVINGDGTPLGVITSAALRDAVLVAARRR